MSSSVSFGTNTNAQRKRVMYFGTSVIYEGMPVCYDNSTTNVLGYDKENSTAGTTTADGYLNEGKFLRVENPNTDNVSMFAGVVAHGPKVGTTGVATGVWLDIFIPNGAVVPVRTDNNCLIDQTILAVTTGSQELGVPLETDSRPVAIARETIDRGTAGLVLAELCPYRFIYQDSGGTALSVDDADTTTATLINSMQINFLGSSIYQKVLYAKGTLSGGGSCIYGMFKFRTTVNSVLTRTAHCLCAQLHFQDDAEIVDVGEFANAAIYATIETDTTTTAADLSGGSVCAMYIGYYVDESTGAPAAAYPFWFNNNNDVDWDGLLHVEAAGDIGDTVHAGTAAHVIGFDSDVALRKIPIKIAGDSLYLLAGTPAETAD